MEARGLILGWGTKIHMLSSAAKLGGGGKQLKQTDKQTNRISPRISVKDVKQQPFCFCIQEVRTETFVHVSILIC